MATIIEEGEPRGEKHGEPRQDGLNLIMIDGEPKYWVNGDGDRVCGAKTSSYSESYKRCSQSGKFIDKDNKRCRNHGGASPKGIAHPSWEGKGKSRYLPANLGARMEEFMKRPDIASVREDLALADLRLSMKLEDMDDGPSREHWDKLKEAVEALEAARRRGDSEAVADAINRIQELVLKGAEESKKWEEVFDIIEQRRKLAETENKRMKQSSNTLTVEEASMLVDLMVNTVMDILDRYDVPRDAYEDLNRATRKILTQ